MDVEELEKMYSDLRECMLVEGFLDSQFTMLQDLEDDEHPSFVSDLVTTFFEEAQRILNELETALGQEIIDLRALDTPVKNLKSNSSNVGALRLKDVCIAFLNFSKEYNDEKCQNCLQEMKREFDLVKNKLERLFSLENQILEAGGSVPKYW